MEHKANDYQPKGGMCTTCEKREESCSDLDFESMPIISIELDAIIVRCTEFQRKTMQSFHCQNTKRRCINEQ